MNIKPKALIAKFCEVCKKHPAVVQTIVGKWLCTGCYAKLRLPEIEEVEKDD